MNDITHTTSNTFDGVKLRSIGIMIVITFLLSLLALALFYVTGLRSHFLTPYLEGPTFSSAVQSNMVLQRNRDIKIYGEAKAEIEIELLLNDTSIVTESLKDGSWSVTLPPQPASSGNEIRLKMGGRTFQTLSDVSFGDVWLCSGQSNMNWPLKNAASGAKIAKQAHKAGIHIAKVARNSQPKKQKNVIFEIDWQLADEEAALDFSAVCWHFGLKLSEHLDVPIGLVQSAWGGTTIEDWISGDYLKKIDGYNDNVELLKAYADDPETTLLNFALKHEAWARKVDIGSYIDDPWFAPNYPDQSWAKAQLPGLWERSGDPRFVDFNGVVWYRKSFDLEETETQGIAKLRLGRIDERAAIWINGQKISESFFTTGDRNHKIPEGVLKKGKNSIAIRVIDQYWDGGLESGVSGQFPLEFANGTLKDLAGEWRIAAGLDFKEAPTVTPPFVPWNAPKGISTLYNGMIAPLAGYMFAGVLWYQGESNVPTYQNYDALTSIWMANWRETFNDTALPFIVTQLTGYGKLNDEAGLKSNWAAMRNTQRNVVQADKNAALVVTLDLGIRNDIHPAHKDLVGERLTRAALRLVYERKDEVTHPTISNITRSREQIEIEFKDTYGGLVTYGGDVVLGFEYCRLDNFCEFASGEIMGNKVILETPSFKAQKIRYAWADYPIINLYSQSGLPVSTFEIDVP